MISWIWLAKQSVVVTNGEEGYYSLTPFRLCWTQARETLKVVRSTRRLFVELKLLVDAVRIYLSKQGCRILSWIISGTGSCIEALYIYFFTEEHRIPEKHIKRQKGFHNTGFRKKKQVRLSDCLVGSSFSLVHRGGRLILSFLLLYSLLDRSRPKLAISEFNIVY